MCATVCTGTRAKLTKRLAAGVLSLSPSPSLTLTISPDRLGALGFMSLHALADETGGTTGNYGVQDQQLALEFAFNNIKNFGGNPSSIVIAGESAGAMSVCWHMVSANSQKYFSAAIMESGSCSTSVFFVNKNRADTFSREVAEKAGCDPTAKDAELLACLREVPFNNFFLDGRQWPRESECLLFWPVNAICATSARACVRVREVSIVAHSCGLALQHMVMALLTLRTRTSSLST